MNLPQPIKAMRLSNVVSAFFLGMFSVFKLLSLPTIPSAVIALYLLVFGALIFTFELHISCTAKVIAGNLGFMYRAIGRTCFMILVGMLTLSHTGSIFGLFVAILVITTALFNGFILFKFPDYEKSCRIVDLGE